MPGFRLATLAVCAASALNAQAPSQPAAIRGTVLSSQELPIPFAVIELRVRRDSAAIRAVQSNEAGRFLLENVAEGVYYILIRRIGYGPATTPDFTVTAGQIRELGMLRLQVAALQLDPVEVTIERADITFEPDRTGYLVEALTTAAGGVVTDALREIPDIIIEIDGTIRLRGGTPAIHINGRPAPMQGVSLSVFLEQFPADRIERIEVLDNPPARYAAEGGAGIINIVLRQGVELGTTGSLSLAAGTRGTYTASGRVTVPRAGGKLVMNAGLNARWGDSRTADFTLRQNLLAEPVTFLRQDARSDRSNRNGGGSFDLRYEFSKRSQLWGRFNGNLNGNDRDGFTETTHLDALQEPTLVYDRLAVHGGHGASGEARIGYSYSWIPERHGIEVEVYLQGNDNRNRTREEIDPDPAYFGDELLPAWLTNREDGNHSSGLGLEVNYVRPWGRLGRIEAGSGFRRNGSRDDLFTSLFEEVGEEVPDLVENRNTRRVQRTGSAYVTLQRRFGKWSAQAGVRGEWVMDRITLPLGDRINRDDANLFPTLNLSWNPRQRLSFRIGFSQRINRPGVSVLDPTDRSTDPLNRSIGNPDIKSSTTRSMNLGLNWGGRLGQINLSPYWNQTTNGWERITTVDSTGVSTSTWDNLTSRTNIGTSFNYTPPRVRGWTTRLNLNVSRSTLTGSLTPDGRDGAVRWAIGGNLNGPIVAGLTAQGGFGYEPGRDLVQGRTSGQWRADFSFRYRMLNNRTSIGMSVQDPFQLRKTTQVIRDPSVIQTGSSRVTTRAVTINISYAFGGGGPRGGGPEVMRMGAP